MLCEVENLSFLQSGSTSFEFLHNALSEADPWKDHSTRGLLLLQSLTFEMDAVCLATSHLKLQSFIKRWMGAQVALKPVHTFQDGYLVLKYVSCLFHRH